MEIPVVNDSPQGTEELSPLQPAPVLCVDLDGTLLATDSLLESVLVLLKQRPWFLFLFPFWVWKGKAHLKRQVSNRVSLDVTSLPYRQDVLNYLKEEFQLGRKLVLATGADEHLAKRINDHLGIFSETLASDGKTNLVGSEKCRILEDRFGFRGFDYIGNNADDLKVWSAANSALVAEPSKKLLQQISQCAHLHRTFISSRHSFVALIKEIRVHQWIKNILIFLPLAAAQQVSEPSYLIQASFAFLSFSFCASGLYIFNDLLDLSADRRHPQKKTRPFASGTLPLQVGLYLFPVLLCGGIFLSWATLPPLFLTVLGLYTLTTIGYSLYLKKLMMLDVMTLAGLYSLRVLAGGVAVGISVSAWLLAFSMFFFLSLAFAKRHGELQLRKVTKYQGVERRAYMGGDKDILCTMGTICGYMSVLVLALYINSQEVSSSYQNPEVLWLVCPLLLYWVSRTWLLAHRGNLNDDPLVIALQDPRSYFIAIAMTVCGLLAI